MKIREVIGIFQFHYRRMPSEVMGKIGSLPTGA
jgi:hypothetical protein